MPGHRPEVARRSGRREAARKPVFLCGRPLQGCTAAFTQILFWRALMMATDTLGL